MKNKIPKIIRVTIALFFWLLVWHISSIIIDNSFLFPGLNDTAKALYALITDVTFYKAVGLSFLRVSVGLVLGCVIGLVLGIVCKKAFIVNDLISPIITFIRSTPVASFIVVLWVLMSGDALSIFIGFLMVMPIIWQSTCDGLDAIDPLLSEVADIFEFSRKKRFKLLVLPTLKNYLAPGIISACGLAWKAEIAAEIIAYTKHSIGQGINDAKYSLDTATVFAWTVVIVVFSIILEKGTKYLLRRCKI